MPEETKDFFADYDAEPVGEPEPTSFIDSDREYPIETRCCITGDEVKHSYCRYPDPALGTMMVMSRESMIRYSRKGGSLSSEFDRVLQLRRKKEKRGTKSS